MHAQSVTALLSIYSVLFVIAAVSCGSNDAKMKTDNATGACALNAFCTCPGSPISGVQVCGPDGVLGPCTGCRTATPSVDPSITTMMSPATAGSVSSPSPSPAAAPKPSCAPGEMCKPAPVGGVNFCTADPAAMVPPNCPMANTPCGTNNLGLCVDGAAAGVAGMNFCIYQSC